MSETPDLPTPLARRFVRYLVGFGVAVAVGSAPFLGTLKVPGFTALLDLFPRQLQGRFVALSPFVMGVVALTLQFYGRDRIARGRLRRWFGGTLALVAAAFLGLVVAYSLVVVEVPYLAGERTARFVVGLERLPRCDCPASLSDAQCLAEELDPGRVERCWSPPVVRSFELVLTLLYLLLTGGFGALVALLVLQPGDGDVEGRRDAGRETSATPEDPAAGPAGGPSGAA